MRTRYCFILLSAFFLMVCCHRTSDHHLVRAAAQGYLDAMANMRPQEARPYASQATIDGIIRFVDEFILPQLDTNRVLRANMEADMPATITILEVAIDSDTTASVKYTKTTPRRTANEEAHLIKEKGEWKVDVQFQAPVGVMQQHQEFDTTRLRHLELHPVSLDSIKARRASR